MMKKVTPRDYVIICRYIQSVNRAGLGYTLAINHLADRTPEEMQVLRGHRQSKGYNGGLPFTPSKKVTEIPDTMDWRLYGEWHRLNP